jgi:hypothetical protein
MSASKSFDMNTSLRSGIASIITALLWCGCTGNVGGDLKVEYGKLDGDNIGVVRKDGAEFYNVVFHDKFIQINHKSNESLTVYLSKESGGIDSLVSRSRSENGLVTLVDMNGDGVPDKRKFDNEPIGELNYNGSWIFYVVSGTNSLIRIGNDKLLLHFDGKKWVRSIASVEAEK